MILIIDGSTATIKHNASGEKGFVIHVVLHVDNVLVEQTIDITLLQHLQHWFLADLFKRVARSRKFPLIFKFAGREYKITKSKAGKLKIKMEG